MSEERTEMEKSKRGLRELFRWIEGNANSLDDSMKFELHNVACNISLDIDKVLVEAKDMREFCKRIEDAAKAREDVTLFGVDYTALPVDADGVAVHVGDVMEWPDSTTAEVVGIGDGTFFYVEGEADMADWSRAGNKVHHTPDTWERIIEDAVALGALMGRRTTQIDDLVARCKELAKEES